MGDLLKFYDLRKKLHGRLARRGSIGPFAKILQKLAKLKTEVSMIDATHLWAYRTAESLKKICATAHIRHCEP
jgi:precorrin-6x reductase